MTAPYIDNYKAIRNKFNPPPKPVVVKRTEVKEQTAPEPAPQIPDPKELPEIDRLAIFGSLVGENYRDMLKDAKMLRAEAEKRGISFYTKLMEGMPTTSKRVKLAAVVVLEEYAIDWKTLFDKDRPRYKTAIRWKVFDALKDEGLSLKEIARLCDVDHTSVLHGLRKIRGVKNV
jgi:hypothetical protein